jgi:hypothetical protein
LKNSVGAALVSGQTSNIFSIEKDLPGRGSFETADQTQDGRFTATRRAEERKEFSLRDRERQRL